MPRAVSVPLPARGPQLPQSPRAPSQNSPRQAPSALPGQRPRAEQSRQQGHGACASPCPVLPALSAGAGPCLGAVWWSAAPLQPVRQVESAHGARALVRASTGPPPRTTLVRAGAGTRAQVHPAPLGGPSQQVMSGAARPQAAGPGPCPRPPRPPNHRRPRRLPCRWAPSLLWRVGDPLPRSAQHDRAARPGRRSLLCTTWTLPGPWKHRWPRLPQVHRPRRCPHRLLSPGPCMVWLPGALPSPASPAPRPRPR
mmetsp:Transcript_2135/g.6165  ORF Transcript_2135/g.6165 Transcript_2135/m.6165 type:complete len:254 (+) Transcript_2135:621-1382(+)